MIPTGFFTSGGLRLALHDAGGMGRPIVFQHGLGGDAAQTCQAVPVTPNLRRITLECPGHGGSDHDLSPSIAGFADHVLAFAQGLPHPLAMGGISMGAAIALRIAVLHPELIGALVLVRPAWGTQAAPTNMQPVAEVAELLRRLPPETAQAAFLSGDTARSLATRSPDNLASLTGYFAHRPAGTFGRMLAAIAADEPGVTQDDLAQICIPTLVCGVGGDVIHPEALARELASSISGARYVELPPKFPDKASHQAMLRSVIAEFLEET